MRNYEIVLCEQRSPTWFQTRAGLVTSSDAPSMLAVPKKKGLVELQEKTHLRTRKAIEILTGRSSDNGGPKSAAMFWGTETEPQAFGAYEAETGILLQRVGFVRHLALRAGCSPDGVAVQGDRIVGGAEFKCPESNTHLAYLRAGVLPDDYRDQVLHDLFVTGADWWDFVSFDPRFCGPIEALSFFRVRVRREDVDLDAYELALRFFLSEVEAEAKEIAGLAARVGVAA